jgi:hypothetical protein
MGSGSVRKVASLLIYLIMINLLWSTSSCFNNNEPDIFLRAEAKAAKVDQELIFYKDSTFQYRDILLGTYSNIISNKTYYGTYTLKDSIIHLNYKDETPAYIGEQIVINKVNILVEIRRMLREDSITYGEFTIMEKSDNVPD